MIDIPIGEHLYRIGRLNAMQQWHVARRWMPVAIAMGSGVMNAAEAADDAAAGDALITVLGAMTDALAKMSDADSDFVINTCLGVCQIKQGEQYAPVRSAAGGIMFDFIDVSTLMRLTMAVIKEHRLGDFMSVLPIAPP